jgi:hypothetical protein
MKILNKRSKLLHYYVLPQVPVSFYVLFCNVNFNFTQVLGDVVVWTVQASDNSVSFREVLCQKDWPCARFSHSAAVWRKQAMIVSGGLGQDVLPLRDIWCFSLEEEKWSEFHVDGMLPRYSHTSAVCGDKLILVGGVNTLPGSQPGVCVVDLNTTSCTEYTLPVSVRQLMQTVYMVKPLWLIS